MISAHQYNWNQLHLFLLIVYDFYVEISLFGDLYMYLWNWVDENMIDNAASWRCSFYYYLGLEK